MEENKKKIKKENKKLGRGINALIPSDSSSAFSQASEIVDTITKDKSRQIINIPIEKILPNPIQPRKYFDQEKIQELSESIENYGILEPILVTEVNNKYHIVAGERRFRASQLANKPDVPSIILNLSDEEKIEIALVENLQREDLNPIETAHSLKNIMTINKITQEELAKKISMSRPAISNFIRLLSLSDEIQSALKKGEISQSHARLLLSIENEEARKNTFYDIIQKKLSVKSLEKKVNDKKNASIITKSMNNYEQKFIEFFGTKVSIIGNLKKGSININYFDEDDFSRILDLLHISLD